MNYPIESALVFEKLTGRVVSSGTYQAPQRMVTATLDVLVGVEATPNEAYVQEGVVVPIGQAPSDFHVFNWVSRQWVANSQFAWNSVKQQRSRLLVASDWRVTKALESDQATPTQWVTYRQALRDITLQTDPWSIVWPVEPQA